MDNLDDGLPLVPTFMQYLEKVNGKSVQNITTVPYNILGDMMVARGFDLRLPDIKSEFKQVHIQLHKNSRTEQESLLVISKLKKLGIKQARYLNTLEYKQITVVVAGEITPLAKKTLCNAQLLSADQLQFRFFDHKMIPTHVKCSREDMKHLPKVKKSQLPVMSRNDPICRFYGWSTGSIIKSIVHFSDTSPPNVKYRIVK